MDNLIHIFKNWLKNDKKLSDSTVDVYLASIRNLNKFYKESYDEEFKYLEEEVINSYWLFLLLSNSPNKTLSARLSAMKKFNEFLIDKGYQSNFVVKQDYRNLNNTKVIQENTLTELDIKKFIMAIIMEGNKRDLALVFLKLKTDITIHELINLELVDYITEGIIVIKGNEERKYYTLNDDIRVVLDNYVTERNNSIHPNSNYLFVSNKSEKLQRRQLFNLFKKYSELANLPTPVTPKKLVEFYYLDVKDILKVQNNFSFVIELEQDYVEISNDFISTKFNEDLFVKLIMKVKYKSCNKKFYYILAKPEIMMKLTKGGNVFLPKGWLFIDRLSYSKISEFIKSLFCHDAETITTVISKLDSISMDLNTFNSVKKM